MNKKIIFSVLSIIVFLYFEISAVEPHFMNDPAISPDGKVVCFVYNSDLWTVPFEGGEAKRLTVSEGAEWSPMFSPNGKYIAFNTNRDGWTALYQIPAEGGFASEITKDDLSIVDWFPDGKYILATGDEPGFGDKFFKVSIDGGYEEITKFGGYYTTISPDGKKIIFAYRGKPYREAYKGSTNGELWEYEISSKNYNRLTKTELTERYPVYSHQNNCVYFGASDGNVFQLYKAENHDFKNRKQLTNFKIWSLRDISIARKNDRMVFEKFDEIWKYNPKTAKAEKLQIEIKQDLAEEPIVKENVINKGNLFKVSPNGKLVVFSYKFDLFAVPEKGDDVIQITHSQNGINDIEIMDDNQTIFFTSFVEGEPKLFKTNITKIEDIKLVKWSENKYIEEIYREKNMLIINFSDDEKRSNIAVADSICENIKTIIEDSYVRNEIRISDDEKYILYLEHRPKLWSHHLYLYDFETEEKYLLLNYDGWLGNLAFGKDGESIFFTKNSKICRLDLLPKRDFYTDEDNWKEILNPKKPEKIDDEKDEEKSKKKVVENLKFDLEDIHQRVKTIVSERGWNKVVHIIDDSTFYYLNYFEDEVNLRKVSYFGENDEKIETFGEDAEGFKFNNANNCFYFSENDTIKKFSLGSKKSEIVKNDFKYEYDKFKLNETIFQRVWTEFGRGFYDPEMHGQNWNEIRKRFSKYTKYAYSAVTLESIVDEMIGEVNSSHTGFYPRNEDKIKTYSQAHCGFILDFQNFPKKGVKIQKVFRKSKLNKPHNVKAGDILLEIDGKKVGEGTEITSLLRDKVGEKIELKIKSENEEKVIVIKGLSSWENYSLYYDNWVEERRQKVEKLSDGKIGYIHIRRMNNTSYKKFIQDLFAENYEKEALIIDVRNNGGGGITDMLIEVLTKKTYAKTTKRYFDNFEMESPANVWQKPTILLVNENSFSDAEIFPTIFKQENLGKVIGMPTGGSVIGTYSYEFMDGTSMRMPANGWFRADGVNMEGNGFQPDILVEPTPEQIIADNDVQLKKAVEELLK